MALKKTMNHLFTCLLHSPRSTVLDHVLAVGAGLAVAAHAGLAVLATDSSTAIPCLENITITSHNLLIYSSKSRGLGSNTHIV